MLHVTINIARNGNGRDETSCVLLDYDTRYVHRYLCLHVALPTVVQSSLMLRLLDAILAQGVFNSRGNLLQACIYWYRAEDEKGASGVSCWALYLSRVGRY